MAHALSDSELTSHEADAIYVQRLAHLLDERNYPGVRAAMLSGALADGGDFSEEDFSFGLATVLDGIATRVQGAARRAGSVERTRR